MLGIISYSTVFVNVKLSSYYIFLVGGVRLSVDVVKGKWKFDIT